MNNETYDPPTEKVLQVSKNIIELMKPLLVADVSDDVLGGIAIWYESEDKTREVWISVLNHNPEYPAILYSIKNMLIHSTDSFSFYDVPHVKRFILGYLEQDLENEFNPKPKFWLHDIYTFVSKNKDEEAMDLLFAKIGDLLDDGEFEKVNDILPTIDLRRLNLNLLVGLLSITRCGTNKPFDFLASYYNPELLPYRPKLVEEVEKVMYEIEPTERIDKLLEGLRK
jgi:hypothetical protein